MRAHWLFVSFTLMLATLLTLPACGNAASTTTSTHASASHLAHPAGRVISVADGDTVTILSADKQKQRIRLAEIDTPERGQPWGANAKRALSSMVYGQQVSLIVHDIDRYGRVVATIFVDGRDINAELVQQGHAWVYRHYLKRPELLQIEADARLNRRGLWALPESERMPPWQWRKLKREQRSQ
ncbi:MAG: thermonuclease family protein [Paraperlucidibaca sp.]